MHASLDTGIICGDWGKVISYRGTVFRDSFREMLSDSHICLSNSEPEILLVLPWARPFRGCCLQSLRLWWKVLLTQWRDALGLWARISRPGRHCLYTPASPGCSPAFLASVPFLPSSWISSPLQSFSHVSLS